MTKKHFDAILAKNSIAREVRNQRFQNEPASLNFIEECLKDIEDYIGQANQPYVVDIIEDADCWL
jgi:hypothetical protein